MIFLEIMTFFPRFFVANICEVCDNAQYTSALLSLTTLFGMGRGGTSQISIQWMNCTGNPGRKRIITDYVVR